MINIRKVGNGYIVDEDRICREVVGSEKEIQVFNKFSDLVKYLKDKLEK